MASTSATRKQFHLFGVSLVFTLLVTIATGEGLSDSRAETSSYSEDYLKPPPTIRLSKFSLTQKGYIQFLRYITPVPAIGDFTFCIWMRSANLTHSHPLLSYSRHESERLIRAWVTPGGSEIKLAVKEIEIINVPVDLKENQWYHICQSWSTNTGHWDLYLDGILKAHGYNAKARGLILSKDGDIVVGQEYTDFDKGLDDGIEGDIFGFNMVLASTSTSQKSQRPLKDSTRYASRRISIPEKIKGHYILATGPLIIRRTSKSLDDDVKNKTTIEETVLKRKKRQSHPLSYVRILPYVPIERITIKQVNPYQYPLNQYAYRYNHPHPIPNMMHPPLPTLKSKISRIANDIPAYSTKPLGLKLVEMSFDCTMGKGSPLRGKDVLISWTKTPVRVFGGAILKKVEPFC